MCTFIVAWRAFANAPVVVAANRDEALDRPSDPPGLYAEEPRIVAPSDERVGGTWIGYNEHGVLAAITNRWIDADLAAERSRGLLVRDVLERESAEEAARFVERELERRSYDGFNLVLLDRNTALLFEWDGGIAVRNLEPGVHVVVNVGADDRFAIPSVREERAREQAESARRARVDLRPRPGETGREWQDRAAEALADHDYGFCVHGDGFGTRSSSLIRFDEDGSVSYEFADGPPCRTEFEPVSVDVEV